MVITFVVRAWKEVSFHVIMLPGLQDWIVKKPVEGHFGDRGQGPGPGSCGGEAVVKMQLVFGY